MPPVRDRLTVQNTGPMKQRPLIPRLYASACAHLARASSSRRGRPERVQPRRGCTPVPARHASVATSTSARDVCVTPTPTEHAVDGVDGEGLDQYRLRSPPAHNGEVVGFQEVSTSKGPTMIRPRAREAGRSGRCAKNVQRQCTVLPGSTFIYASFGSSLDK